jgi:hypothetical protein
METPIKSDNNLLLMILIHHHHRISVLMRASEQAVVNAQHGLLLADAALADHLKIIISNHNCTQKFVFVIKIK